jgi:hypothetical protein
MPSGGPRPGAGRPKGAKDEIKPDRRAELIEKYGDPLERLLKAIDGQDPDNQLDRKNGLSSA